MVDHEKSGDWTVNSNSWHFKFYQIVVAMWCSWTENPRFWYENVNLCTYVRMITFYFPMMIVIFGGILMSPLWIPFVMWKWYGSGPVIAAFWSAAYVVGWIIVVIVILWLGYYLYDKLQESRRKKTRPKKSLHKEIPPNELIIVNHVKEKTFFQLFIQWWQDKHSLVCRPITIVNPEEKTKGD